MTPYLQFLGQTAMEGPRSYEIARDLLVTLWPGEEIATWSFVVASVCPSCHTMRSTESGENETQRGVSIEAKYLFLYHVPGALTCWMIKLLNPPSFSIMISHDWLQAWHCNFLSYKSHEVSQNQFQALSELKNFTRFQRYSCLSMCF